jgi:hypothetical protein
MNTVAHQDMELLQEAWELGGVSFESPSGGGSHYKLRFPSNHCWTSDRNWGNDIGDNVLKQLKNYCSYPLTVIKVALVTGGLPKRHLRLRLS